MYGINSVTEALESQSLEIVIICKDDVKPPFVIAHFPFMCLLAQSRLVILPKGSAAELALAFGADTKCGVDSCVWGIKKGDKSSVETVERIKSMVPGMEAIDKWQPLQVEKRPCIPNLKRRARKEAKRTAKKIKTT